MTTKQLDSLLRKHKLYLKGYKCGKRLDLNKADLSRANLRGADLREADLKGADLKGADLRWADLREADLRWADLSGADLKGADLSGADLREADLKGADLKGADLRWADLRWADLSGADLKGANLREADLREADLRWADLREADLRGANLSRAKGLLSSIDYLEKNFEKTNQGYLAYKIFGLYHNIPDSWKIEENYIIKENVDTDRSKTCSYGINAGTLKYIEGINEHEKQTIYKMLIKYEWLSGVVVPYNTQGSIRCERALILGKMDTN